jgi:hypothetical protein
MVQIERHASAMWPLREEPPPKQSAANDGVSDDSYCTWRMFVAWRDGVRSDDATAGYARRLLVNPGLAPSASGESALSSCHDNLARRLGGDLLLTTMCLECNSLRRFVSRSRIRRAIIFIIGCLATMSCWHGPPEGVIWISDFDVAPDGRLMIALRPFYVARDARGLSAFPDGGLPRYVDQGVEAYLCDKGGGSFTKIGYLHAMGDTASGFGDSKVREWGDSTVTFSREKVSDVTLPLPRGVHAGVGPRHQFFANALPECQAALNALGSSNRMPDGTRQPTF